MSRWWKCAVVALMVVALSAAALAQQRAMPKIFIQASPDFATALTAAMIKKHVSVIVTEDKTKADYVLQSAAVDSKNESGAGKIARCMFLDCIGMNGFSEVSVRLIRNGDAAVVWAYQVRKGNSGPAGIQSMSEAIAKHLKNDYLKKLGKS